MWGTLMALVITATILGTSMDAFALSSSGGKKHGDGGGENWSGGEYSSYSTYEGSWENGNYVVSTPEPGTLILLASGAAGLVLWVRRRK